MSIATDVSRIKGNITAALAAIVDKGVTVPAGSNSDALAGLIASIEAEGGGVLMTTGTIQFSEQTDITHPNYYMVDHGLNVYPDLIVVRPNTLYPNNSDNMYIGNVLHKFKITSNAYTNINIYAKNSETGLIHAGNSYSPNETTFAIGCLGSSVKTIIPVQEYIWFAFVWRNV